MTTDLSSLTSSRDLTFTQYRMVELLRDERPHTRFELHRCLRDPLASLTTMRMHISLLRKKLKLHGYGITWELLSGESYYRLVRLSPPPRE